MITKMTRRQLRRLINEALRPFFFAAAPSNEIQMLIHDPRIRNQQLKDLLKKDPEFQRMGMELFLSDISGNLNMKLKDAEEYLKEHYPNLYTQYKLVTATNSFEGQKLSLQPYLYKDIIGADSDVLPFEPADPIEKSSKEYQKHFDDALKTRSELIQQSRDYQVQKAFELYFSEFQGEAERILAKHPETNSQGDPSFFINVRVSHNPNFEGAAIIRFPDKQFLEKIKSHARRKGLLPGYASMASAYEYDPEEEFRTKIMMPKDHPLIKSVRQRQAQA